MKETTILGIGNILLQDEGFGIRVIEELQNKYTFSDNVRILDGGTLGLGLLRFISGTKKLLVVDAISGGCAPGTFYKLAGDEVTTYFKERVSLHELGLTDILAVLELMENPVEEVVVFGVEPESLTYSLDLSTTIARQVDRAVSEVVAQLANWDMPVGEKNNH